LAAERRVEVRAVAVEQREIRAAGGEGGGDGAAEVAAGAGDQYVLDSHGNGLLQAARAGAIVPAQSPKPMRRQPGRSQCPRRITVSPSSRKLRCSPSASCNGCLPPTDSSSIEPPWPGAGPDCVPEPRRSPGCRLQPLT